MGIAKKMQLMNQITQERMRKRAEEGGAGLMDD